MTPITKTEVEEAHRERPRVPISYVRGLRRIVEEMQDQYGALSEVGFLLIGYEIARERAERGEEL